MLGKHWPRPKGLRALWLTIVLALAVAPTHGQSGPTLRQLAIIHGGIGRVTMGCGPQPSFANVVHPADLIVEATIQRSLSYLTADDDDVYTDYETTIHWVFFQRHALATSRPGVAIPILLKSHGGQVMIGDVRISVDESWGNARVSVREGDRV